MKITLNGKEVIVTVYAPERDLTAQEIIAAHQLSTGNFEALFVDTTENEQEEPQEKPQAKVVKEWNAQPEQQLKEPHWIEKGEQVKTEVNCPFCGHHGKADTWWGNSFTKCPECKEPLFNRFATDKPAEKNSWGCVYVSDSRMTFKHKPDPYAEIFEESDS